MITAMSSSLESQTRPSPNSRNSARFTGNENGGATSCVHRHLAQGSRMAPAKKLSVAARNSRRCRRQHLVHLARRIRKSAAHRRPHRFRSNGGWLDGCLNVVAAWKICDASIRNTTASRPSPCALWIGRMKKRALRQKSFGSSACSGNLDMTKRRLVDKAGHQFGRRG